MIQTELTLSGSALRDVGIERAHDHAEVECPVWSERALEFVRQYPHRKFTSEEIRLFAAARGLPEPSEPRAWGSVFVQAKKRGLIQFHEYQKSANRQAHRRPVTVWIKAA